MHSVRLSVVVVPWPEYVGRGDALGITARPIRRHSPPAGQLGEKAGLLICVLCSVETLGDDWNTLSDVWQRIPGRSQWETITRKGMLTHSPSLITAPVGHSKMVWDESAGPRDCRGSLVHLWWCLSPAGSSWTGAGWWTSWAGSSRRSCPRCPRCCTSTWSWWTCLREKNQSSTSDTCLDRSLLR